MSNRIRQPRAGTPSGYRLDCPGLVRLMPGDAGSPARLLPGPLPPRRREYGRP